MFVNFCKHFGRIISIIVVSTLVMLVWCSTMFSATISSAEPLLSLWKNTDATVHTTISQRTTLYDTNNNVFATVWNENRKTASSLADFSPFLVDAVVSAEDRGFYKHGALDVAATVRSLVKRSGGGSGITQQLVKNLQYYDTSQDSKTRLAATATTISRKVRELKQAVNFEKTHSKNAILLQYLNTIAMGAPNVYGAATAAETLFSKNLKDLTLKESAALAGSVNNPSLYNIRNISIPQVAQRVENRTKYVLQRMLIDGKISQKQYDDAVKEKLVLRPTFLKGDCSQSKYPFYCQYVMNFLQDYRLLGSTPQERSSMLRKGGLEVHTSMDPTMMDQLNSRIKSDWGVKNSKVQASAVVQPGTGHVLAIGANRDYGVDANSGQTQLVLADTPTQTGSTYKMITLATALNNGWTEQRLDEINSMCPWRKAGFETPAGGIRNSTSCALQGGRIGYKRATAYSSNTYFVELESQVGVNKVKDFSRSVGLAAPDSIGPSSASYTLGVVENSPISMAAAFATFANRGVYCPATPISSIKYSNGRNIVPPDDYDPKMDSCRTVMSPYAASVVLKAQNANVNDTSIPGRIGRAAAISNRNTLGKSGTTDDWANTVWTQTVGNYTVFSNAYDPRGAFRYPMTRFLWRGGVYGGYSDTVLKTTRDFIATNLGNTPNVGLDFNNNNRNWLKTSTFSPNMVVVPNLEGLTPSAAISVLHNLGLEGRVLKTTVRKPNYVKNWAGYADSDVEGFVVSQTVEPNTMLANGSKRIIGLNVTKIVKK